MEYMLVRILQTLLDRFIDRLNARDVAGILRLLEDDIVHHDLAHEQPTTSKLVRRGWEHINSSVMPSVSQHHSSSRDVQEVARFYQELLSSMSDNMVFVVDDITDGESLSVGLTWCGACLDAATVHDAVSAVTTHRSPLHSAGTLLSRVSSSPLERVSGFTRSTRTGRSPMSARARSISSR